MSRRTNTALAAILLAFAVALPASAAQSQEKWNASEIMAPHQLLKMLSGKSGTRPLVLQVGFQFLYEGGHIAGSKWAGPASRPDGIRRLKETLKDVPKNRSVVIYCGCCPWSECPNVLPAYELMKEMGYKNVKSLYIPIDFAHDWIDKGYPITKGNKPGPR